MGERLPADWPGDPSREDIEARALWRTLGLTDDEYARIREGLGRVPNWTELGMFSVAWSEHCAYKHSREALRRLPTSGGRLLVGPGENAGVLDIGGGWAVAVRLESHNHPSFVEPYQGAATGVGGIVRDVLAAGARPVALLNALRFGRPDDGLRSDASAKNRYLFREVVAGIAGYGNAIGVPTVGGELAFDPCFDTNPLVNVMCVGLLPSDRVVRARAQGAGNPVYLVGARTGRDGIHGAGLLASRAFEEGGEDGSAQRPRVQVGDPFMEKLLIEACLEALATGAVLAIQDLGAAGITAASSELAARGGTGMDLDLDRVPRREPGMTPYELMLSESQERMMLVVHAQRAGEVEAVFDRWKLPWARIGTVTRDGRLRVRQQGQLVADVPAALLADGALRYEVPSASFDPTRRLTADRTRRVTARPEPAPAETVPALTVPALAELRERVGQQLRDHLASADGGDRSWIYTQFDHMVGLRTVLPPGHDAAVLRVPEAGVAVALSIDGAERLAGESPYLAAAEAVFEGARNVAAAGATPIGITNGLNLASPERPEVMQQLADLVAGIADACRALDIPVSGGNVSLYNETGERRIVPTAIVGMVGLLAGASPVPSTFRRAGDRVVLIGDPYLHLPGAPPGAPTPELWPLDFAAERRSIEFVAAAGREGLLESCHDTSGQGLAVTLVEAALGAAEGADGFSVELPLLGQAGGDVLRLLFGWGGPCWVASVSPERVADLKGRAEQAGVALRAVGTVAPGRLRLAVEGVGTVMDESTAELRRLWKQALERASQAAAGGQGL